MSRRSAIANQARPVPHTSAYWLMLTVRDAIPKPCDLANAESSTMRLRLIGIAARVVETASRVRPAYTAGCPEADLFRSRPGAWRRWDPEGQGARPPPPAVTLKRSRKSASRQAVKNPERTHATEISPTRKNPEIECAHE